MDNTVLTKDRINKHNKKHRNDYILFWIIIILFWITLII